MDRRKILLVVAVVVAALGAGLVFVYASGAEDRAKDEVASVRVLVAIKTIPPGESASDAANAGKLLVKEIPADQKLDGATDDGKVFTDSIALTTIYPGEQLLVKKFGTIEDIEAAATLPLPKGKTAITLELTDAGRVGSFTKPGAHVAVYFTPFLGDDPDGDTTGGTTGGTDGQSSGDTPDNVVRVSPACAIEEDLLVLGVGSQSVDQRPAVAPVEGEVAPQEDTVPVTLLTVAVDSEQASTLIGFQTASAEEDSPALTFALRNDESVIENTALCVEYLELFEQGFALPDDSTNG